jgi:hypothetical protein
MADKVMVQTPDGTVQSVPAPANVVLTCAPPGPGSRMLKPGQYKVTDDTKMECSTQPLYDFQSYAAAGQTSMTFFQTPNGQSSKTLANTNMTNAGMLPAPQQFLIQGVGVRYISGLPAGAIGASSANSIVNDANAILKAGVFQLNISSKTYLTIFPLAELPCRAYTAGMGALSDSTTAGAGQASKMDLYWEVGDVFRPNPLLLTPTMNFSATIIWPTAIAIPSADASAQIGVYLYGSLYRPAQ